MNKWLAVAVFGISTVAGLGVSVRTAAPSDARVERSVQRQIDARLHQRLEALLARRTFTASNP